MSGRGRPWWRFVPAAAWAALIFALSSRSSLPTFIAGVVGLDKLVHAAFYAVLTALLLGADGGRRPAAWAALAALYGLSDEVHQAFVPGRDSDVRDWLADVAGASACAAVWRFAGPWAAARLSAARQRRRRAAALSAGAAGPAAGAPPGRR